MVGQRPFLLSEQGGTVMAAWKDGRLEPVRTTELRETGEVTTFESQSAAKRQLRAMVIANGMGEDDLQTAIGRMTGAPPDSRIEIAPGIEFANWTATECMPTLSSQFAEQRFALKIAYELLSICLREQVFHDGLAEVRICLLTKGPIPGNIVIEGLRAKAYTPFHSCSTCPSHTFR
jgi:hypothetical protein